MQGKNLINMINRFICTRVLKHNSNIHTSWTWDNIKKCPRKQFYFNKYCSDNQEIARLFREQIRLFVLCFIQATTSALGYIEPHTETHTEPDPESESESESIPDLSYIVDLCHNIPHQMQYNCTFCAPALFFSFMIIVLNTIAHNNTFKNGMRKFKFLPDQDEKRVLNNMRYFVTECLDKMLLDEYDRTHFINAVKECNPGFVVAIQYFIAANKNDNALWQLP
jgi:hypothetical protein